MGGINIENEFMKPERHKGFLVKKLFHEMGKIHWGAIAYIEKDGGGPENNHTHSDNHIFVVANGEVKIISGDQEIIAGKDQSMFFVDGMIPHSIWNNGDKTAVVIKISTERWTPDAQISICRQEILLGISCYF